MTSAEGRICHLIERRRGRLSAVAGAPATPSSEEGAPDGSGRPRL